jgi:hypothetical protein
MKQFIYLPLIFLFVCCTNPDDVFVTPNAIDWGTLHVGDTIRLTPVLKNQSKYDMMINYVNTPCGCTIAIPRENHVKSGDSTVIDIKFSPFDYGYIEQHLFVQFKNRKTPVHFILKGKVKRDE